MSWITGFDDESRPSFQYGAGSIRYTLLYLHPVHSAVSATVVFPIYTHSQPTKHSHIYIYKYKYKSMLVFICMYKLPVSIPLRRVYAIAMVILWTLLLQFWCHIVFKDSFYISIHHLFFSRLCLYLQLILSASFSLFFSSCFLYIHLRTKPGNESFNNRGRFEDCTQVHRDIMEEIKDNTRVCKDALIVWSM